MSMIERMTILGIRSFGVREEDRQVIEFQHPLTLIVGQNGAGKTTVIECLKYATTGDQPANTKGGAFVHDPKLVGESEVRAQVGLKFSDLQGRICSVKRSLQVTQKADKAILKTLDSVISKAKGDEQVSTTSKCTDINIEMVNSLGVSKAVLDNVIFCHQEDSNWPLSEGKVLKNKFDEIFAATRYIKALDVIKMTKKAKEKSYREEKPRLPFLEEYRETAKEKRQKLKEEEFKLSAAKESANQLENQLKPICDQLKEKREVQNEILELDIKLRQSCDRQNHLKKDREMLAERIQNLFHGTDAQLTQLIQGQEDLLQNKRNKLDNCQYQIEPIKKEIDAFTKRKNKLILRQGELQQEYKSFQTKQEERVELLVKTSDEHDVCKGQVHIGQEVSEDDAARFESEMKRVVRKNEETMNAKQKRLEEDIDSCSKEIQNVFGSKTEIEEGVKHKKQSIKDKSRKIEEIKREISNLQSSSDMDRLEELQKQLENAEKELKNAEESYNVNELKQEVKNLSKIKSQREHNLKQIDEEIENMREHQKSRTKIEEWKNQQKDREDKMRKIKYRNSDSLISINLLQSDKNIDEQLFPSRQNLSRWISKKSDEEKMLRKDLDKKKQELTKLSTRLDMLTRDLRDKNSRTKEIEEIMFELCGSEDFEEDLKQVDADIKELQGSKGLTDGIQFMYKEFLKKLRASDDHQNTPCPLCHRLFDQAQEVEELAEELHRKLELAPRKMLTQEQDLEKKRKRYQMLLQQRPAKEEMDKLNSEVIPDIKKQITDLKNKITEVRQIIDAKEAAVRKVQEECATAQSCSNDVAQVESIVTEIKDLTRKIGFEEAQLPTSGSSGQSYDTLSAEKQKLSAEIQKYSKTIDDKRDQIEKQTDTLRLFGENVNLLQGEKLKIAADVEKCKQLKESQKTMLNEIKQLQQQCRESHDKISPLERQLSELENKKRLATKTRDDEMKVANNHLQSMKSTYQDIVKSNAEIKKYLNSGRLNSLKQTQNATTRIESELDSKEKELNKLRDEITHIEKELATCKDRQRDLDDNRNLRKQDEVINETTSTIENMKERIKGLDSRKLEGEITELSNKWHSLTKEKERCATRQEGIKENVNSVKKELEKEDLKHADERHKDCLIKVTTLKLAIEDLEKYHNALDRAIMRYHSMKMSEINKIIREIWTETYRGHDIDYIEICSDEDSTTSSSARRVYNYRLIKCSQGQKIDMRGRCSAGQKVLASLVIRLALAETFCINCGILALDEPTTNLDRYHIESLAGALVSIIESREKQRNFQLIVITHDEDFVELLGRSNHVDHYFRVEKKDGKSRISKFSIETLE
uniref:DNA repair protein RAD50-like n=1 Tax=Styela clava TaxID=7725 RepID=UPI00193ABDF6|nr:DNA repair protein RAD50-like [Styela clava]